MLSSFLPIILVPECAEGGLVGQTMITNGKKYPNCLHIGGKLLILMKTFSLWSCKSAATKGIWFWLAVFSQIYAIITKNDHHKVKQKFMFSWPISMQYNFWLQYSAKNTNSRFCWNSEFHHRDPASCSFLLGDIRSASCLLTTVALCPWNVCWEETEPATVSSFFYVSNWLCCLPTENAACEQFSSTKCHIQISWDFGFFFNCASAVIEQLIMNLNPIHFFGTGWTLLEEGIRQFSIGNWELRDFLLIWYVRWQNRRDNALLHSFCTLLFLIPKTLACLSEAMNLLS